MKRSSVSILMSLAVSLLAVQSAEGSADGRRWLSGDHHVHSLYSARYLADPARPDALPAPILGGDSPHTVLQNAHKARMFGLDWIVITDHGGPRHSELNYSMAWPDVVAVRSAFPDLVIFYGMEFDVPGGEHATLMLPISPAERETLRQIESGFGKREPFPPNQERNTKAHMIEALEFMARFPEPPIIIANHPSRTATGPGEWGLHSPQEYHAWQQAAPRVVIGMEGSPGHQAASPKPGLDANHGARGLYGRFPTMGGYDQMVATLGGGWDALLGRGLRWTVTATSDSHGHWSVGGADFWPGEYSRTWVWAEPTSADIMQGLRAGRVFSVTGDLIDQLDFRAEVAGSPERTASMGDALSVRSHETVLVTIRIRPARGPNAAGMVPEVDHVDLIFGALTEDGGDRNPTTRVVHRFSAADWQRDGDTLVMEHRLSLPATSGYLRLRGTNTGQGEPEPDRPGEDPWLDLWFYSNPIYLGG